MPITTTLNRIRAHGPCESVWKKLLAGLGKTSADNEPLPYAEILEINGLDDALWCCRAEPDFSREWRLFAVWCARQVEHLNPDQRVKAAIDTAERFAGGEATEEELAAAWAAAGDAAGDATGGARAAAWAAGGAAAWAAGAAAWDAAEAAARAAARAAAWAAAWAARDAAGGIAAWAAARDAQAKKFREIVEA